VSEIQDALERATQAVKDADDVKAANAAIVEILTACAVRLETRIERAIRILQGANDV